MNSMVNQYIENGPSYTFKHVELPHHHLSPPRHPHPHSRIHSRTLPEVLYVCEYSRSVVISVFHYEQKEKMKNVYGKPSHMFATTIEYIAITVVCSMYLLIYILAKER
jgi:hypothetical protein